MTGLQLAYDNSSHPKINLSFGGFVQFYLDLVWEPATGIPSQYLSFWSGTSSSYMYVQAVPWPYIDILTKFTPSPPDLQNTFNLPLVSGNFLPRVVLPRTKDNATPQNLWQDVDNDAEQQNMSPDWQAGTEILMKVVPMLLFMDKPTTTPILAKSWTSDTEPLIYLHCPFKFVLSIFVFFSLSQLMVLG